MSDELDSTRLTLLLNELRLPALKQMWPTFAEHSDKEGWPAARLLTASAEHELAERDRRRIERHLAEAKLLPGKTLENFDFDAVPMVSKAQVPALCAGDTWLRNGANLILMAPPAEASRTCRPPSAWPCSRRAGACFSPAPPISCSGYSSRVASSPWNRR
jgi:DNA replication protein DnaC